jgi:DNA-binding response OmpR family regulator
LDNPGSLIYIVDDEPDIVDLVSVVLESSGFQVKGFLDGRALYTALKQKKPDLVILDLMLPDEDGFEILRDLRKGDEFSRLPVVILSAKTSESDKVVGLELGANDYITKPFSTRELTARIKSILRDKEKDGTAKTIKILDILTIDLERYETFVYGERVELTSTEFRLLTLLASKKGFVFSREQILDHLWGLKKTVIDRTVDMHIKSLRKKLKGAAPLIRTLRGVGYKLEE